MKRALILVGLTMFAGCSKPEDESSHPDSAADATVIDGEVIDRFDRDVEVYSGGPSIDDTIEEAAGKTPNDVLDECGVGDDVDDLSHETFATVMHYKFLRVINAGIATAYVPLTSVLDLRGTIGSTTLDVGVDVDYDAIDGESELAVVEDRKSIVERAEEIANRYRGPATAKAVPLNGEFDKQWKGILCAIIGAESYENKRDGAHTIADFDPPIPPNVSPVADRIRHEEELGDYRFFRDVVATVVSTDHPALKKGQKITGSSLVERIPNEKITPHGTIKGDIAYRVTHKFGTEEQTLALGLHLWTEFYIDYKTKNYSAVIANVGDVEIMHFYKFGRSSDAQ